MKSAPMMTAAEELTLISRWREGDQRALDRLILQHQWLVRKMARPFSARYSGDDLMQEGNIGLLLAAERFDPGRGFRFGTYARWWIMAALTEYRAANNGTVFITRGMRKRLPPMLRYVSLDKPVGEGLGTVADIMPSDQPTPEEIAIQASEDRRVRASMQKLQQRERFIIEQRMDEDSCLKDIGKALGVSGSRVQQIEARAMRLLRADLMPRRVEGRA